MSGTRYFSDEPDFTRRAHLYADLSVDEAHYPGWEQLRELGERSKQPATSTTAFAFGKLLGSRAKLAQRLAELPAEARQGAEIHILNTIGFAKAVLEAERDATRRATIQTYNESDLAPTGLHMVKKQRADQLFDKIPDTELQVDHIQEARNALPIANPARVALYPESQAPYFYGYAELLGMARAGVTPALTSEFFMDSPVTGTGNRSLTYWNHADAIVDSLKTDAQDPVARLHDMYVELPEALLVASMPTPETVLFVADAIAWRFGPRQ